MVYMFNELSIAKLTSGESARDLLEVFVNLYIRSAELGLDEIRLHKETLPGLYYLPLSDDYNIDIWLNDKRVNSDLQDRFREIITSSPLITIEETNEHDLFNRSEFNKELNGKVHQVWGLGAAYICQAIAVSLSTHKEWEKTEVQILHYYLDENAEEIKEDVSVRQFSTIETLNAHVKWLEKIQLDSLNKSAELWEKRKEFFPNLELCAEVEKQLQKIGVSKTLFQIVERLKSLDEYVKNWTTGEFNYEDVNQNTNLKISPESPSTLRKFGTLRKFSVPDIGKETFDLHIKTGDLRFHFYPDNNNKKVYVGYIGKHLRIASEN